MVGGQEHTVFNRGSQCFPISQTITFEIVFVPKGVSESSSVPNLPDISAILGRSNHQSGDDCNGGGGGNHGGGGSGYQDPPSRDGSGKRGPDGCDELLTNESKRHCGASREAKESHNPDDAKSDHSDSQDTLILGGFRGGDGNEHDQDHDDSVSPRISVSSRVRRGMTGCAADLKDVTLRRIGHITESVLDAIGASEGAARHET